MEVNGTPFFSLGNIIARQVYQNVGYNTFPTKHRPSYTDQIYLAQKLPLMFHVSLGMCLG